MSNISSFEPVQNIMQGKRGNTARRCAASQWHKHQEAIKVDLQREISQSTAKYIANQEKMYLAQIEREQTGIMLKQVERCRAARENLKVYEFSEVQIT